MAACLGVEAEISVIGTRHGEKLYETLATREELARAEDQGDYYRVPVDARDLNYSQYFEDGDVTERTLDDYHSHNTTRLDSRGVQQAPSRAPCLRQFAARRKRISMSRRQSMPATVRVLAIHRYYWPDTPPYASILRAIARQLE